MRKLPLGILLLLLAPALVLGASEPVYKGTIDFNYDFSTEPGDQLLTPLANAVSGAPAFTIANNKIFLTDTIVESTTSQRMALVIYNIDGGAPASVSSVTHNCISIPNILRWTPIWAEGLLVSTYGFGSPCYLTGRRMISWDVSNLGFVNAQSITGLLGGSSPGTFGDYIWTNGNAVEFFNNHHLWEDNGTAFNYLGDIGSPYFPYYLPTGDYFYDRENRVYFASGLNGFVGYDGDSPDEYNETKALISTAPIGASLPADWNKNWLNPEYITQDGRLVIFGGGTSYTNPQLSSTSINFDKYFFFERDNIIGVINDTFAWVDWSDVLNPNVTYGSTQLNADYIWRVDLNHIVTYNTTTREMNIYEVPIPDIELPPSATNTKPTADLSFLGRDTSGRFVFGASVTDEQTGRVYTALDVKKFPEEINLSSVFNEIDFSSAGDLDYVDTGGTPTIATNTSYVEYNLGGSLRVDGGYVGDTIIDIDDVTSVDNENVSVWTSFSTEPETISTDVVWSSFGVRDLYDDYVYFFLFERSVDNNNINISYWNGSAMSVIATEETFTSGDFLIIETNVDFVNDEIFYDIKDRSATTLVSGTFDALKNVESVATAHYNDFMLGSVELLVDYIFTEYDATETLPGYEIFASLQAGERETKALRDESASVYGIYEATLYLTDDFYGLADYDTYVTLGFTYDANTPTLTESEIAQEIADIQSGLALVDNDGFNTLEVVEGDLVTDTFFSFIDDYNIKTPASKFLVGLILIFISIGIGASLGGNLNAIASAVGSVFGAVGGLFLVTYWGLFPAWVSLVITLVVFVIVASMARNALTGRGD